MDLRIEIVKAIYRKYLEGARELGPNQFRESKCVDDIRKQVYDKLYPDFEWNAENPRRGIEYTVDSLGIWHIPHHVGTAVSGTVLHEFLENALGHLVLNHEERVTRTRGVIERSGTVDREYDDNDRGRVINDVKSTNINVIYSIARGPKESGYTGKKVKKSGKQGNSYGVAKGVEAFNILYMDRDAYSFLLTWHDVSFQADERIWYNEKRVTEHVENGTLPDTCDGMCDLPRNKQYCRHHREYPTVDKSGANCPGRLALAKAAKNRKPEDEYDD
jgi:hypothetical protein